MDENIKNMLNAKRKKSDLNKLIKMYTIINKLKDNITIDSNLIKILLDIADLAGGENGISFNQVDSNCIRNKYGYIQRSKSNKGINPTGIYFEKLYHLKVILNDSPSVSDIEIEQLTNNLFNLQMKIVNILKQENEFPFEDELIKATQESRANSVEQNYTEEDEFRFDSVNYVKETQKSSLSPKEHNFMIDIRKFSTQRYETIALKKIKEEIISFEIENSKSDIRDDMYYFARKFIIIGELSQEMIEDEDKTIEKDVLSALKNFRDIRDFFMHRHMETQNYANNKVKIENIISQLKENLSIIIKYDDQKTVLNYDLKSTESLNENSKELNSIINNIKSKCAQTEEIITASASNVVKTNAVSSTNNSSTTKSLNKLKSKLILASKIIEDHEKSLKNLNKEYQNERQENLTENKESYPKDLSVNNKQDIIKLADEYDKSRKKKQKKSQNKTGKNEKKIKTINTSNTDSNSTNLLNKFENLIINAANAFDKFDESFDKLNSDYQEIKKELIEEFKSYPETLSINNKQSIINLGKKLKKESEQIKENKRKEIDEENKTKELKKTRFRITDILKNINDEIQYLVKIEQQENINEKQKYIMDHIVSLIGQYRRDLDEAYSKSIELGDHNLISPFPNISQIASGSAKYARSNELAHDIFSLDRESLDKRIKDDIVPACFQFESLSRIYEYKYCLDKNMPIYVGVYIILGFYCFYLQMLEEGIKYFEPAIKRMEEIYTKEYFLSNMELEEINIPDGHKISFEMCINNTSLDKACFNLSHTYLVLIKMLANNYIICGEYADYDKVYELVKPIYTKIRESVKDEKTDHLINLQYHSYISQISAIVAECLHHRQDNTYLEALKIAERFSDSPWDDYGIIQIYLKLENYKKVDELCESILKDSNDPEIMFIVLFIKSFLYEELNLKEDDVHKLANEINQILSQIDDLIKNHGPLLKARKSDVYIGKDLGIINLELFLIKKNIQLINEKKIHYDFNLKLKLKKSEKKFANLIRNLKIITPILFKLYQRTYEYFTLLFCQIIIVEKLISENEFEEMFNKANYYFDKISSLWIKKPKLAWYLAMACEHYVTIQEEQESEKCIKYLKQTLEIIKPYTNDTEINEFVQDFLYQLGRQYCNLGLKCDNPMDAFENHKKSIDFLQKIDLDANIKFPKKYIYFLFIANYEEMVKIKPDLESLNQAILYSEKVIELINIEIVYLKTTEETNKNEQISELKNKKIVLEVFKQQTIQHKSKIIQNEID